MSSATSESPVSKVPQISELVLSSLDVEDIETSTTTIPAKDGLKIFIKTWVSNIH